MALPCPLLHRSYPTSGQPDHCPVHLPRYHAYVPVPSRFRRACSLTRSRTAVYLGPNNERQDLWLEDTLRKSTADWLFVCGHHPVYSIGRHGPTPRLVNQLRPLLEKYKVAAYLCGHDHNLQHIQGAPAWPLPSPTHLSLMMHKYLLLLRKYDDTYPPRSLRRY